MPSRDGRWAGPLSSHALSLPDRRQARSPSRCASQSSSRSSQSASTPWCGPAWRRVNIFHVVLKLGHACCSPRARLGGKGAAPATYCTATLSFPPPLSQRRMPSRAPLNLPLGWRGPASVAPASRHRPARRPSSPDARLSPASRPPPHCLIPPLWRPPSSAGAFPPPGLRRQQHFGAPACCLRWRRCRHHGGPACPACAACTACTAGAAPPSGLHGGSAGLSGATLSV